MRKRTFYISALVLIVAGSLLWSYKFGCLRFNYPDPSEFPVRGIDVSHHQGVIDWKRVAKDRVHFVFIKATEGGDYRDHEFGRNWTGASNAGLPRGAYHFFTFGRSGLEQARNFLAVVPRDAAALPAVVDFEFTGNSKARPPRYLVLKELSGFIKEIEEVTKKPVLIYTTGNVYNEYLKGGSCRNEIWIRDILGRPVLPDNRKWLFWQYANNGRIAGIPGPVDLNVYCSGKDRFFSFIRK